MLLFSSNEVDVFYTESSSKYLLITFSPVGFVADGKNFWGKSIAEKNGISTLGFVASRPNWYPEVQMGPAIAAVSAVVNRFNVKVTYGSSMGAYAALKYSTRLGADTALAFGPQWTINPTKLSEVGRRWSQHYDEAIHEEMEITPPEICSRPYIFYDPFTPADRAHCDHLFALAPQARQVKLFCVGHDVLRLFAGSAISARIISSCLNDEYKIVAEQGQRLRRGGAMRAGVALQFWLDRNPDRAFALFDVYKQSLSPSEILRFSQDAAQTMLDRRNYEEAKRIALLGIERNPDDLVLLKLLAKACLQLGNLQLSAEWEKKILLVSPNNDGARQRLANINSTQSTGGE